MNPNYQDLTRPSTPMQYVSYFLEIALKMLEKDPKEAEKAIKDALSLTKDLDPYLQNHASEENALLHKLREKTVQKNWDPLFETGKTKKRLHPLMLTGIYEGALLKMLAQLIKAKRILDIGMFTGYSTLTLASILPKEGEIVACEKESYLIEFAKPFFEESGFSDQIQIRNAPALETLKKLAEEKQTFDFIFIDANKREYLDYYLAIKEGNLISKNGLICADNTLMKGLVYAECGTKTTLARSIAKFNRFVHEDPSVEQVILPVRDGLSVIKCHAGESSTST